MPQKVQSFELEARALEEEEEAVDIWYFSHIYVFVTLLMPYCDASCIT